MLIVIILCTVLGVASTLGTLGNSLVFLAVIKFENLRDISDLFIFSLSLSDLLVTTLYQPLKAYRLAHLKDVSTQMDILIRWSGFLGYVSLIASISNMLGVTMERLISIRFPLKYDFLITKKRAIFTILCIWAFSITYGAIWSEDLVPASYLSIYFIVVLFGTVSIYVYIFLVTRRLEISTVQLAQNGSIDENRCNHHKERKAAKTIALILGVAITCWIPILIIPRFFARDQDVDLIVFLKSSLQVLSVCNSSINPYIYCMRSQRYYIAFIKLLGLQKILSKKGQVTSRVLPHSCNLRPHARTPCRGKAVLNDMTA